MSADSPLAAPRSRVIGTAGHVDHGKSTLVRTLTGIDPDRLAEEKRREMTIDLGFAWLTLDDGQTVGIVDVPGHRDFIENMLAGIGGIDAVLFVIAADEGVMPQTREHLNIVDLLGIDHGVVVLTKTDLIDDAEWLALIRDEVRAALVGTTLASAPILPVSSYTGAGIEALKTSLIALLAELPSQPNGGLPRLPIDRVFSMSGFGTVVTGTLMGNALHIGDEIEIQPSGRRGRIRGLQSYHRQVEQASPGARVAVNLSGIDKDEIVRGDVLTLPGQMQPSQLIDVRFRHLRDAPRPLSHNAAVKLFTGTAERNAVVRLIGFESLAPGDEAWLQLRLDQRVAVATGDRFILRSPSPAATIGGGMIIDPHPAQRWKRFDPAVIDHFTVRAQGTPSRRLARAAFALLEPVKRETLAKLVGFGDAEFEAALIESLEHGIMVEFPDGSLMNTERWHTLAATIRTELTRFHTDFPLRAGMPREELRSRLHLKPSSLNTVIAALDFVVESGAALRLNSHEIRFTPAQAVLVSDLLARMNTAPYTPPSTAEARASVGYDVLYALIERGDLVQVQPDIIFSRDAYEAMVGGVMKRLQTSGSILATQLRDDFGTSRKYAIALLEHLDSLGMTRREGDARVAGQRKPL